LGRSWPGVLVSVADAGVVFAVGAGAMLAAFYVVASPRLVEADCETVEQMRLVNALCRFVEVAESPARVPAGRSGHDR
jgi:hypothetical protein